MRPDRRRWRGLGVPPSPVPDPNVVLLRARIERELERIVFDRGELDTMIGQIARWRSRLDDREAALRQELAALTPPYLAAP